MLPKRGVWVQSLVGELRSCMPCGMAIKAQGEKKKVGIERIFSCEQTESLLSENLSGCVHKEATFMVWITQVWADLLWSTFFLARFLILGIIKLGRKSLLYLRILWPPQSSNTAKLQSSYNVQERNIKKEGPGHLPCFHIRYLMLPLLYRKQVQRSCLHPHCLYSVQSLSHVPMQPHGPQHASPPCPSPTPRVYSNSCPFSWWCHPTISSSVVPFSSHLQSFPASGSFQTSQFFTSMGGQSIGVSTSTSVLPLNIQDWFHLGWTGWISLQSKGLSSVFSNTTIQKHQFFSTQLSL